MPRERLAPQITHDQVSRPELSVPNQWAAEGSAVLSSMVGPSACGLKTPGW